MNKIILVGNLTRDIELKYTQAGKAVGSSGIAVTKKRKDASGNLVEDVLFVDLTFWGRSAEVANQYMRKGSKILVEGELKLDTWTDNNGAKRSKHGVTVLSMTMLDCKDKTSAPAQSGGYTAPSHQGGYNPPQQSQAPAPSAHPAQTALPEIDINDDEIPF